MAEPFNLICLPEHILIKIFSCMSYNEMSRCREVCQSFNRICSRELTKSFVRVDRLHSQIQKRIKSQLPRKESERRNHALSRFVDVLSALETRLSLLSMTYTKYIDMELCCFIPGMVLDELYQLLYRLQNTNTQPPKAYDLLQPLRDQSTMAMEHFEEHIVPLLKAQIQERSQTLYFSPSSTASSSAHSPLALCTMTSTPLDVTAISMMDCAWPVPMNVVSSPWRRTPLKLDVQRMQSQMQMHSAAIATMTKEYREQKVKIGEQARFITEQDRQLQEQRRQIEELKSHVQAQEKNLETLTSHIAVVTGKEISLPETKTWDPTLWNPAHKPSSSSQDHSFPDMGFFPDVVDRKTRFKHFSPASDDEHDFLQLRPGRSHRTGGRTRHARQTLSATAGSDDISPVEQFLYQSNELHQSLSSKCATKCLLAQIALAIQGIASDHSLPVCLEEVPKEKVSTSKDDQNDLVNQLADAQRQLSVFNEEHVGCSICQAEDSSSRLPAQHSDTKNELRSPSLQSVTNQGLVNRAQELYNKLNSLTQDKITKPLSTSDNEKSAESNKVKGKASLKRKLTDSTKEKADTPKFSHKVRRRRR